MKSLLMAIIVGVVLFAASAGASWFLLLQKSMVGAEVSKMEEDPAERALSFVPPVKDEEKVDSMPVSLRPVVPITVEAVTELAQSIMQKERVLLEGEKRLKKEEKRVALLFEDLKREQDELTAFGQKIDAKIVRARELMELLKLENKNLDEQTQALSKLEKKTGKKFEDLATDELDKRVATVKNWFKNLETEAAASYLKEFADRGELEFAARLLDSLEDRKIAKILAAFNDAPLVAQIVDAYTKTKTATGTSSPLRR